MADDVDRTAELIGFLGCIVAPIVSCLVGAVVMWLLR